MRGEGTTRMISDARRKPVRRGLEAAGTQPTGTIIGAATMALLGKVRHGVRLPYLIDPGTRPLEKAIIDIAWPTRRPCRKEAGTPRRVQVAEEIGGEKTIRD